MIRYWPGFEPTEQDLRSRMAYPLFGIECGPGWDGLLAPVFAYLQQWNVDHPHEPIVVAQVKEKYSTLRFYTSSVTEELETLIDHAEHLSAITCEECGRTAQSSHEHGWWVTLCQPHLEAYRAVH